MSRRPTPEPRGRPEPYDVSVVGGRCSGSPTAMLLARRDLRVLLVDRAVFPSAVVSSHLVHESYAPPRFQLDLLLDVDQGMSNAFRDADLVAG